MKTVTIIGLGYVGLPLACLCAEKGYKVTGFDIDKKKVEAVNKGKSPIKDKDLTEWLPKVRKNLSATTDEREIRHSDIIIICVPTPVDENYHPDLGPVVNSSKSVSRNLRKGQLVVVESTIYPGVIEEVVRPTLEESGLKAGKDFHLAHCPERIDPGNRKWNVRNIPRVVGGVSPESTKKAASFYRSIIEANILELSSVKAAEATKIMENTFRDVNIAFVNELAKSFDNLGIDITEVIKAASTKPFGFLPHYPGCGVGGHCIPVDPYYLIEKARSKGFTHSFLALARQINDSMPDYTVKKVISALNEVGKPVKGTKICVLGVSYKKDVGDLRESPAFKVIQLLKKLGANLSIYDPYVPEKSTVKNLNECLKNECLVLVTDHSEFRNMDYKKLKNSKVKVIVDGRNCLDKGKIIKSGIIYKGIGR